MMSRLKDVDDSTERFVAVHVKVEILEERQVEDEDAFVNKFNHLEESEKDHDPSLDEHDEDWGGKRKPGKRRSRGGTARRPTRKVASGNSNTKDGGQKSGNAMGGKGKCSSIIIQADKKGKGEGEWFLNEAIKEELGSEDDDYEPDKDESDADCGENKKVGRGIKEKRSTRIASEEKQEDERKRLSRLKFKELREQQKDRASDIGEKRKDDSKTTSEKETRPLKMTSEEKREKEKERKRLYRLKQKEMMGKQGNSSIDNEETTMTKRISLTCVGGGERRKKRISEMTDEEKEEMRARWREQRQRRRERIYEIPAEVKHERVIKDHQPKKKKRSLKDDLTEGERIRVEEQLRKDRERKRAKRAAMTPEEKREVSQKLYMSKVMRKAAMSEDELKMKKMEAYLQYAAKNASRTPEEIQQRRERANEAARKRREKMRNDPDPEKMKEILQRKREARKRYRDNMPPEKRLVFLEKMKENYRRWRVQAKRDPEKLAKWKQTLRENNLKRAERLRELRGRNSKKGRKPTRRKANQNEGRVPLTDEEKKERRRLLLQRSRLRQKLEIQRKLESGMTMEEIHEQMYSPERRARHCLRIRRNWARRDLRMKLRLTGASEEEVVQKVKDMDANWQPVMQFRPYKPRPEMWKQISAGDLQRLVDEIDGIDSNPLLISSSPKPSTSSATIFGDLQVPKKGIGRHPTKSFQLSILDSDVRTKTTTTSVITSIDNLATVPHQQTTILPHQTQQFSSPSVGTGYQAQYHNVCHPQSTPHYHPTPMLAYAYQQPHSHFLQSVLDGMVSQETGGASSSSHQYTTAESPSTTSSYHQPDYSCSYGGDDVRESNCSSLGAGDQQDCISPTNIQHNNLYYNPYPNHSTTTKNAKPTPKITRSKSNKKPAVYVPRPGAQRRQKRSEVIRDVVCDECGQAFSRFTLKGHQNVAHNPNFDFKTKTCLLCNETFRASYRWYTHYLRVHVKPTKLELRPEMCADCGKTFKVKDHLLRHQYSAHGDGTKKENYRKCPVCPEEKLFKDIVSLKIHMQRLHPDSTLIVGDRQCCRCDDNFLTEKLLTEHVRVQHPESYFPCDYCQAMRFSQLGLNFHYGQCKKIAAPVRNEMVTNWDKGLYSVDRMQMKCQFCEKGMRMTCLRAHFKTVHGVSENKKFVCSQCNKQFKCREFLAVHLEEVHCMLVKEEDEELWEYLRQLNADDMEGLREQPNPPPKRIKRVTKGGWEEGTMMNIQEGGKKVRRSSRRHGSGTEGEDAGREWSSKKNSTEEDSNEEEVGEVKERRNIRVICEEDGEH